MAKRVGKKKEAQKADELEGLPSLNRNAAGIDVGSVTHYVAVPPGRDAEPVQEFGSFTADLHRMAQWLQACKVDSVVMQATGVYWTALYDVLESRDDLPEPEGSPHQPALAVGETPAPLLNAFGRLLDLVDSPEDIPFLSPLIKREITYRILRAPQGDRLRAIATRGDLSNKTARAIAWLKANYTGPLRMEELAGIARMGVSTLHHQFRALTGMSPLQYQKQLRLQEARRRMLTDGIDATSAAYEVGYESVSQFSREYRRLFGQPPKRDVRSLRDLKVEAMDAA
jgi:AraC-like DNA-binding protein